MLFSTDNHLLTMENVEAGEYLEPGSFAEISKCIEFFYCLWSLEFWSQLKINLKIGVLLSWLERSLCFIFILPVPNQLLSLIFLLQLNELTGQKFLTFTPYFSCFLTSPIQSSVLMCWCWVSEEDKGVMDWFGHRVIHSLKNKRIWIALIFQNRLFKRMQSIIPL